MHPKERRLRLEQLEDRRLLATLVVNSFSDIPVDLSDNVVTLRDALDAANNDLAVSPSGPVGAGADVITFDPSLAGALIRLRQGELLVTEAITIDGGTLDISITGNRSGNDRLIAGTFITDVAATLVINSSWLDDNTRVFNIIGQNSATTIIGLTLTGGRTKSGRDVIGNGAGVRSDATLIFINSTVSGNYATRDFSPGDSFARGGGIWGGNSVALTNSTVSGNFTRGARAEGGGIYGLDTVTLTDSTVSENVTDGNYGGGGGIYGRSDITLTNSTVRRNSTAPSFDGNGGGIHGFGNVIDIINSTISGNSITGSQTKGGGIYGNRYDQYGLPLITLTNSTVSGNSAAGFLASGGGISGFGLVLANSLITGNAGGDINALGITRMGGTIQGGTLRDGGNLVETGLTAAEIFESTIEVIDGSGSATGIFTGVLADHGGPTATIALLPSGAAVDTGDSTISTPPAFDQRGEPFARIIGDNIDIGAFEVQAAESADFDTDGDIDGSDFLAWQRGLGTPNAAKTDGDADNDQGVDVDDLGIWEDQYGSSGLAAASAISTSKGVPVDPLALSTPSSFAVADANAIDAAIALAVTELSSEQIEDRFVFEDPVLLDFLGPASTNLADKVSPRSDRSAIGEHNTSRTSGRDERQEEESSDDVFDELMTRIFG